jgi:carboxymethylenebutenolidase
MGHYIELQAKDGLAFRAFLVEPVGPPQAALVLLQEMDQRTPEWIKPRARSSQTLPGVNRHIRAMASEYAAQGYVVLCPSTFCRGLSGRDYGYCFGSIVHWESRLIKPLQPLPSAALRPVIEAAVAHARRASPGARVGLVGYCWGALLAWRTAAQLDDLQAVVCFYGGGMDSAADQALTASVPVQVHLPAGDEWMPAQAVQDFVQAQSSLSEASGLAGPQMHLYDAPYGFAQTGRRSHHPQAAQLAHTRSLQFLSQHLVTPTDTESA